MRGRRALGVIYEVLNVVKSKGKPGGVVGVRTDRIRRRRGLGISKIRKGG